MQVFNKWEIWKADGLTIESYIQCDKFIELSADEFTGKKFGALMTVDIIGVKQMAAYHGLNIQG